MMKSLRNYFLTGLLVLIPSVVTVYIFYRTFIFIDGLLGDSFGQWVSITLFGYRVPGIGFVLVVLLILVVGVIARNIIGGKVIRWAEDVLTKIPLINSVYRGIQQISQALLSERKGFFKTPVLIEYPRRDVFSIAFLTSEYQSVKVREGVRVLSVFLPTTPNPTSGFFLMLPEADVRRLAMSVEDAMKLVISGGAVRLPGQDADGNL